MSGYYARGRGLYSRWRQSTYVTPVIPTVASSREERGAYEDHIQNVESLWLLLAQAAKGAAVLVVPRNERNEHPNGREAWLEGHIYMARESMTSVQCNC